MKNWLFKKLKNAVEILEPIILSHLKVIKLINKNLLKRKNLKEDFKDLRHSIKIALHNLIK